MKEIGLVTSIKDLGVTQGMLDGIAKATFILKGGYKVLTQDEIIGVLKNSLNG
jgi:butanol dehydrogenase